jgi:hypothetical protein
MGKEGDTKVEGSTAGGEGGDTKVTPKPDLKVEPKVETKPEPKGEVKTEGGGTSKLKRAQISIEDEIPEDAELLELSKTALTSRLKRHTARELRERFGTDDTNEIKLKLERLATLEAEEETRKREAMSEKERLEADLRTAQTEKEDLNRRLRMMENERVVQHEDVRITKIAHKYIDGDEDTTEVVFRRFASYLKAEHGDQLKDPNFNVPDKEIDKWFRKYAEDHPKHAREQKAAPEKRPLNNGADTRETPSAENKSGTQVGGKNFSPSGPNAMSSAQARDEAHKQGYNW